MSKFLTVCFPVVVMFLWGKQFFKDKLAKFVLAMYIVGFAEAALLMETGERQMHGNFGWGLALGLSFLWIVSLCIYFSNFEKEKVYLLKKGYYILKIKYGFAMLVLLWHFLAGVTYYIDLLMDMNVQL